MLVLALVAREKLLHASVTTMSCGGNWLLVPIGLGSLGSWGDNWCLRGSIADWSLGSCSSQNRLSCSQNRLCRGQNRLCCGQDRCLSGSNRLNRSGSVFILSFGGGSYDGLNRRSEAESFGSSSHNGLYCGSKGVSCRGDSGSSLDKRGLLDGSMG